MSIKKITLPGGETRWEFYNLRSGRGSSGVRRRFLSKIDAQNFASEHGVEMRKLKLMNGGVVEFDDTTLSSEAEYWLTTKGLQFSPGYKKRVEGTLKVLLPKYGHLSPQKFHSGLLTRIQTELIRDRKLSAGSANKEINILTGILQHSAQSQRIPINPSSGFKRLKEQDKEITFWEQWEAEKFLTFSNSKYPVGSEDRWIYLVYLLALNTGLRAGEIWGLTTRSIRHGRSLLQIVEQFDRVGKCLRPLKDKEERMVPCNELLYKELVAWTSGNLFKNNGLENNRIFIFLNEARNPICHDNFRKRVFGPDVLECGEVSRITFHDLRHTAATLMISKGVDVPTVQSILGHEDISTTMRYVHCLKPRSESSSR